MLCDCQGTGQSTRGVNSAEEGKEERRNALKESKREEESRRKVTWVTRAGWRRGEVFSRRDTPRFYPKKVCLLAASCPCLSRVSQPSTSHYYPVHADVAFATSYSPSLLRPTACSPVRSSSPSPPLALRRVASCLVTVETCVSGEALHRWRPSDPRHHPPALQLDPPVSSPPLPLPTLTPSPLSPLAAVTPYPLRHLPPPPPSPPRQTA